MVLNVSHHSAEPAKTPSTNSAEVIKLPPGSPSPKPEKTMAKFRACLEKINSPEVYDSFLHSGFFTLLRGDAHSDTREETLLKLARHFRLAD